MRRFIEWAIASGETPQTRVAILRAQSASFSSKVPVLYAILCIDAATIMLTHAGVAPPFWAIVVPGLLILGCFVRMGVWISRRRKPVSVAVGERRVLGTMAITSALCVLYVGWALALCAYGDTAMRGQVAATFGVTSIFCIYCMVQMPAAALIMSATIPAFAFYLVASDQPTLNALGVALLAVSVGMVFMIVSAARDFTRMVAAQVAAEDLGARNAQLANVDSLTELANRRRFFDRLAEVVARKPQRFYVGVLDLDGFKPVNDVFGHVAGDRVLVECAARFRALGGADIFFARLGGDEFGVIVENVADDAGILRLGQEICDAMRDPFVIDDGVASIAASVGFAAYPTAAENPRQLYERADYALYFAKQTRRGRPVLFSPVHEQRMKGIAVLEQGLRGADLEAELSLRYQPLCRASSGAVVAFEALARWTNPELGEVAPDRFVAVAERSDIIHAMTRTLLRKALAAARTWPDQVGLSFNLSARDLISPSAVAQIVAIVEQSGVDPRRIDFEITETALMTDFERASAALRTLKQTGVRIALDDFGTGYSSLNYVHRLPLDRIKIDRGFVSEMETSEAAFDIVSTMIAMCRNLRLECVIEGVETDRQAELLRGCGADLMQGYRFSRPLTHGATLAFLAAAPSVRRSA